MYSTGGEPHAEVAYIICIGLTKVRVFSHLEVPLKAHIPQPWSKPKARMRVMTQEELEFLPRQNGRSSSLLPR
jgi:hypothetical protein